MKIYQVLIETCKHEVIIWHHITTDICCSFATCLSEIMKLSAFLNPRDFRTNIMKNVTKLQITQLKSDSETKHNMQSSVQSAH